MGKPIFNPYGMDPGFRAVYDPYQDEQTSLSMSCPKCGTEIFYDISKCPECGEKITWVIPCSDQDRKKMKRKIWIKRILFAGCIILLIAGVIIFFPYSFINT